MGDRFRADRSITFSRESIVEFAAEYDPQPFHLDEAAGEASPWRPRRQRPPQLLRLQPPLDGGVLPAGRVPGETRHRRPPVPPAVRPGDSLTVDVVVADKRVSESDPERGYVDADVIGSDAEGTEVVSWRVLEMVRREPAASSESD
ncbi:acyl dehydratase [Halobellus ruber]|uniref:acyl dehydratase n=1 Tax=Halobellus ruber TaxID=2761102 RepID=UPI001C8ACF77|nr:acyl dehydratase [Halobellus ruber]